MITSINEFKKYNESIVKEPDSTTWFNYNKNDKK